MIFYYRFADFILSWLPVATTTPELSAISENMSPKLKIGWFHKKENYRLKKFSMCVKFRKWIELILF